MRPSFWLALLAGAVGSQIILWLTRLPLGIPGEWTWHRVPGEPDALWNLIGITTAGVLYVSFVEAGTRRLSRSVSSPNALLESAAWLIALVVVAFTWFWVVQEAAPMQNRLGKSAFVLYYSNSSGYFAKARYETTEPAALLAAYEDLMRERDVLHVGTHPPGLFLVFQSLIKACQKSPLLSNVLDATQPMSFREACDVIARNSAHSDPPRPLLPADRRVLWLAALLVMISASLATLPLYLLIRRTCDRAIAWQAAALWPAIPAIAIFTPKSDVVYAFVGLLIVWTWLSAVDRRSFVLAFVTGLLVWCGLMMSLAFLPVVLFLAIAGWKPRPATSENDSASAPRSWPNSAPPLECLIAGACGFVIPTLLLGWYCHINMASVWKLNYLNHAAFYAQYSRTYWKWVLENPLELAFAAGWPIVMLAGIFVIKTIASRQLVLTPIVLGVVVVWGILWLTGKNSGEAARLWVLFMPWLVWLAGLQLVQVESTRHRLRPSMVILVTQLAMCALTVTRISGFEL